MNDTETLYGSIANPRRTTLSGRTHAEVLEVQQSSREDDSDR